MIEDSSSRTIPAQGSQLAPLSQELGSVALGDQRLTKRLGLVVDAMSERADESFPHALRRLPGQRGAAGHRRPRHDRARALG